MRPIGIFHYVYIQTEINRAHNGVSALFMDDVFDGGAIGVKNLVKPVENGICAPLIRMRSEKSRGAFLQAKSLSQFFTVFFRDILLSFKSGSQPYFIYSDFLRQVGIRKAGFFFLPVLKLPAYWHSADGSDTRHCS